MTRDSLAPAPAQTGFPARLPTGLVVLALPCLLFGLLGMFLAFTELSGALQDRRVAVERVRDAQLMLYDTGRQVPVLQRLQRADVERLSLLLGDERFERRGVAVPMALLGLLSSWLLLTGALGTLRRKEPALALWRWACLVNIPLAVLAMLVTLVQARDLLQHLGPQLAQALSRVSHRDVATELKDIDAWTQAYVLGWGIFYGAWVLWLAVTGVALRRHLRELPEAPPELA